MAFTAGWLAGWPARQWPGGGAGQLAAQVSSICRSEDQEKQLFIFQDDDPPISNFGIIG